MRKVALQKHNISIFTELKKEQILINVKKIKHLQNNALRDNSMFCDFKEIDTHSISFKPFMGLINIGMYLWEFVITFNNLENNQIQFKVEQRVNPIFIIWTTLLSIVIIFFFIPFVSTNGVDAFSVISSIVFVLFIVLSIVMNYHVSKSYLKRIKAALLKAMEGRVEL